MEIICQKKLTVNPELTLTEDRAGDDEQGVNDLSFQSMAVETQSMLSNCSTPKKTLFCTILIQQMKLGVLLKSSQ